ncbi:uncharacterized protein LOC122380232 [Amphibalanus amphitrite]|uniref:uncharacterized protein LOC122380232 n=1 Tax=Amphibalanus amphitrite TaxID=1232801 RepID=UPI001C90080B|nr:uncharacterized protein LOC122380232 [Amphibalanus amphitrite]
MASIIVLNIQYKGVWGFPVPSWLRVVMFDVLARVLFISVPPRIRQTQVSPQQTRESSASMADQYPQRPRTGRAVRDDGFVKRPSQRQLDELAAKVLGPATTLHVRTDAGGGDDTGERRASGAGRWGRGRGRAG